MTELLALPQKPRLAHKTLHNTGAGVKKGSTFAQKARIRATGIHDHAEVDHVELLFDEHEEHHRPETLPLTLERNLATPATLQVQHPPPGLHQPLDDTTHEPDTIADLHYAPSSRSVTPLPMAEIIPLLRVHHSAEYTSNSSSGRNTPEASRYACSSAVEMVEANVLYGETLVPNIVNLHRATTSMNSERTAILT